MRIALILLLAGLCTLAIMDWTRPAADGWPDAEPRVLAHYMPWFRAEPGPGGSMLWEHWQWFGKGPKHDPDDVLDDGRRDIASVFYPLVGPYHGQDPDILEYHLLSARAAGIGGFITDWYGPGTYSDETTAALLASAERHHVKVAVCLEEKAFFPGYATGIVTRADVLNEMERHVRHVLARHAPSPAYLRRAGRPVLFMFIGHGDSAVGPLNLAPEELADVLGRFTNQPLLVRGHYDPAYAGVTGASYAWCGDAAYRAQFYAAAGPARRAGQLGYWVGVASPGFDDSGVNGWGQAPRITDRRGTQEYEDNWQQVLEANPDAVQIVTWNDFQEGTTIEPAREYGHLFLDVTERYVRDFTGRPSSFGDNTWGYRVYRVRERIRAAGNREDARALVARTDAFVRDAIRNARWLMGWRLARLERAAAQLPPGDETGAPSGANEEESPR